MQPLTIENLSYHYGSKPALSEVSFALESGSFNALLGPNGAGKSTLFSLLTRLIATKSGKISISGYALSNEPRKALANLGVVFQQPTLDLDVSVKTNLKYFAALQGIDGKEAERRIETCLDRLAMAERKNEIVRSLNGGHRRRMEIARALIHQPSMLLLDEATVGLDAQSRHDITKHVHSLTEDGITVLWATHLVDEIEADDNVIILHLGKILKTGAAKDIAGDKPLKETFLSLTGNTGNKD